jgi:hypothetical protein
MKEYLPAIICCLILLSCVSNDEGPLYSGQSLAIERARTLCGVSREEMRWLGDLIDEMETDVALQGNIYGIYTSSGVVFIHQPFIMSCLACVGYDCKGNRIASPTHLSKQIVNGMKRENIIYERDL